MRGQTTEGEDASSLCRDPRPRARCATAAAQHKPCGPFADPRDDGFYYDLRDRETGRGFSAYSGASGPSYGGPIHGGDALRPVLEDFERLLDATEPVDCELTYSADDEYGGGKRVVGYRDGKSFDRAVK